jgi:bacillithiol biosynthesis deacetylase BshB1
MNVLALGIHPDDIELFCGGTVALAVERGHHVTLVDLSDGAASTNGTAEERRKEAAAAAAIMGVAGRRTLALPDTGIHSEDAGQLRQVVEALRQARPDVVLTPSSDDPHPDHASGGELVRRAIYLSAVQGYERGQTAWAIRTVMVYGGRIEVEPHVIVDVTSTHRKKLLAIQAHVTQFAPAPGRRPTPLNAPEFLPAVEGRDRLYGRKIGVAYGEAFRLLYPLPLTDLSVFGA